ncbi:hypothetical protein M885DRAFT_514622 [Pelagophyceae sp. CCMP2097]|nr:hypothetical protein M885DRAFT_514622 [Pelagophyceae sp. CCMP2097]|mmetsp:Transcript_18709/g.63211  ORF Transcript_18709/g.63211 Transcript_18709/m.63211 type:complete len:185 (-) Transcript_18709:79-633(-)
MSSKDEKKKVGSFAAYNSLLARYPTGMNSLQGAVIQAISVLVSNAVAGEGADWHGVRTMTIVSTTFITPMLMHFYGFLGKSRLSMAPKMAVDQLLFSPCFTFGIITYRAVVSAALTNGAPPSFGEIWGQVVAMAGILPGIMVKSWAFWVPLRFLILNFVPPMLHIVVGSALALIWNVILQLALR